jgi:hypothetical protein
MLQMLLAILECIFKSGLPPTQGDSGVPGDFGEVGVMKILDVLETGIIKMDVGLNDVGSRALARGEESETIFVGELLRWLRWRSGILPLASKEGTITQPTTGAVGVDAVEEEEEEDDKGDKGDEDDENKDIFGEVLDNTVSSTTPHPRVPAETSSTLPSPTDSAYTTLSVVNTSHPETGTSMMNMASNDD